jgi:peptidoglycan-N-acetylglucosamine deacetylase
VPRGLVTSRLAARAGNSVLLTFDDGPHPEVTPGVLDRLDRYGARAIFFVVGRRAIEAPQIVREIRSRGHLVGNHTFLHPDNYVLASAGGTPFWEYLADSRRCSKTIASIVRSQPRYFRPPGGRLTPVTVAVPRLLGMRCLTWSREISDWQFRSEAEAVAGADDLADRIVPRDIVLLHDDNPCVLPLLDRLLPRLRSRALDLSFGVTSIEA